MGVHRSAITRFMQKHPELAEFESEIIENQLDFTEAKLFEKIRNGDTRAITYYLDAKGQDRGFGLKRFGLADAKGKVADPATLIAPRREVNADEWRKQHAPDGAQTIQ